MRTVTCATDGCENYNIPIEVPDDGMRVVCGGGCGNTLAEQDDAKYDPPEPEPPTVETVARMLGNLTPDQIRLLKDALDAKPTKLRATVRAS